MKIDIDLIQVDKASRIRQDIGNLSKLQESINDVGLINPILVDEQYRLIAGYRRLCACKNLKWKEVEIHVVELEDDELKMLEAEAAENMYRVDFTPEEILAIHKRREEIAEARRHKGVFERFWTWLKSLFAPKPAREKKPEPVPKAADQPVQKEPVEKPRAQAAVEDDAAKDEVVDQPAEAENEDESEEQPAAAAEGSNHIPKQPSSAEIVEENGVRHIKWR